MRVPISLVVASTLTACGALYDRPATLPAEITVPAGSYVRFEAAVYSGGSPGPKAVEQLSATLGDPALATLELDEGARVWVYGERVGSSSLEVQFVHPKHQTREKKSIPIHVIAARTRAPVELDKPLPTAQVHELLDRSGRLWACELDAQRAWPDCFAPRGHGGKRYLYSDSTRASGILQDSADVCIAVVNGSVVGWAISDDPRRQQYDVTGAVAGTPCAKTGNGTVLAP